MASCRLRLFTISEYTLMLILPCAHMLRRQSRVASLSYVIFMQSLIVELVLTRLDHGNAKLAGLADQSPIRLHFYVSYIDCVLPVVSCLRNFIVWVTQRVDSGCARRGQRISDSGCARRGQRISDSGAPDSFMTFCTLIYIYISSSHESVAQPRLG